MAKEKTLKFNSISVKILECFLLFSTPLCAQITSEANSFRRGDKVERQQVAYMPLEENSQHAVWDLSGMEAMNNTAMRFIGEEENTKQGILR